MPEVTSIYLPGVGPRANPIPMEAKVGSFTAMVPVCGEMEFETS